MSRRGRLVAPLRACFGAFEALLGFKWRPATPLCTWPKAFLRVCPGARGGPRKVRRGVFARRIRCQRCVSPKPTHSFFQKPFDSISGRGYHDRNVCLDSDTVGGMLARFRARPLHPPYPPVGMFFEGRRPARTCRTHAHALANPPGARGLEAERFNVLNGDQGNQPRGANLKRSHS